MAIAEENISINEIIRSRNIPGAGGKIPLNNSSNMPETTHKAPTRYSIILSLPLSP